MEPQIDVQQVMLDQLTRVVLLDTIHALIFVGIAVLAYLLFRD